MNVATDWAEIPITFRAKCYECGKEILPGPAFWSDSKKSAKHLNCSKLKSQVGEVKTPPSSKPWKEKKLRKLETHLKSLN